MDDNGQKLPDEAQEPEQTENTTSVRSEIYDWLLCIVCLFSHLQSVLSAS